MMHKLATHLPPDWEKLLRPLVTTATTVLVLAGIGALIYYFYSVTALLGMVLIITYLLLGPVNGMEKLILALSGWANRWPVYHQWVSVTPPVNARILAVLLVYFVFFAAVGVGIGQMLPVASVQLGDMSRKISVQLVDASDQAIDWANLHLGQGAVRRLFAKDIDQAERQGVLKTHMPVGKPVTEEEKQVIQQTVLQTTVLQVEHTLWSLVPNFITLVGGTLNGFLYFLDGVVLTFFLLIDGHRLKRECLRLVPPNGRATVSYLLESFHQVMFAFIKGQVLLGLLTGAYMFCVYSLFHVPYAFLLGCVFALAELLPVVGTWIGIGIGLIVILLNMPPVVAVWVWLCSYAYQTVKDNILAPKVVGDVMGLHPMVIILALLVCAKVAGVLGVLLALPLASAINVIIRLLLQKDSHEKGGLIQPVGSGWPVDLADRDEDEA